MEGTLQIQLQRVEGRYSTMTMSSTAIQLLGKFCSTQHTGTPDSESWMLAIHLLSLTHLASHGHRITKSDTGWDVRMRILTMIGIVQKEADTLE